MADETLIVRCYAELNERLPPGQRQREVAMPLPEPPTVRSAIAVLGLAERDVDLALVNGRPAGLAQPLAPGDRLSLYPPFRSLDVDSVSAMPEPPAEAPRFVLDVHLGGLARLLRMLGFDTLWRQDWSDRELAEIATRERRLLLTRDQRLAAGLSQSDTPRAEKPRAQLAEVCARLRLLPWARPFTRCMLCNAPVAPVSKAEVWERLPARTRREHERFFRCTGCGQVYWEGSHHRDMQALLERLAAGEAERGDS